MRAKSVLGTLSRAMLLLGLSAVVTASGAQGKKVPPGQAKKHVTPAAAVVVTREVLVKQGFDVVRVEHVGVTEVVYYRRGNMGRGRGRGPIERMVVRPSGTVVIFEQAPAPILAEIRIRLGL
jgi:hypothetical protein